MFFEQSSKWKVVCLTKMHLISKNWEGVFDFQYKVAIGQCDTYALKIFASIKLIWASNPTNNSKHSHLFFLKSWHDWAEPNWHHSVAVSWPRESIPDLLALFRPLYCVMCRNNKLSAIRNRERSTSANIWKSLPLIRATPYCNSRMLKTIRWKKKRIWNRNMSLVLIVF